MKVNSKIALWIAWLMLTAVLVLSNLMFVNKVQYLEKQIEYQEEVDLMLFENLQELSHKTDTLKLIK